MSTDVQDPAATGEQPPEGEETAPAVAWLPDADEKTVEYLASRGWDKDPAGALKAQRESEAALRREQQARAEMERELAEARQALQQGAQQRPQGNDDPFGIAAAAEAYENGQISMAEFAQYQNAAILSAAEQIAAQAVAQRVDPIANRQHASDLESAAAEIASTYPDFADLSDEVLALMAKHPQRYNDAEGMWAAYGLVKSRHQVAESKQRQKAEEAETLDTGGKGVGHEDAAEAIRKQLRDIGTPSAGL